jgi:hypothetical protein
MSVFWFLINIITISYNSYDSKNDKMSSLVFVLVTLLTLFWFAEPLGVELSVPSDGPRYDSNSSGSPPKVSSWNARRYYNK